MALLESRLTAAGEDDEDEEDEEADEEGDDEDGAGTKKSPKIQKLLCYTFYSLTFSVVSWPNGSRS